MFVVIELQKLAADNIATIINAYPTEAAANARYHTILTAAATSGLLKHAAIMLNESGTYRKSECYGTEMGNAAE